MKSVTVVKTDSETLSKFSQTESASYFSKYENYSRSSHDGSVSRYDRGENISRDSGQGHSILEKDNASRFSKTEYTSRYSKSDVNFNMENDCNDSNFERRSRYFKSGKSSRYSKSGRKSRYSNPKSGSQSRYSNRSSQSARTAKSIKTAKSHYSNFSSKTCRTRRTAISNERDLIMELLPHIKQFYDNRKEREFLVENDTSVINGTMVFFPNKGGMITDRLSGQDSGIARDMSEFSQGRSTFRKEHGTEKGYTYGAPLSPVKSETSSKGRHSARSLKSPKEWRKFFDELPNAAERRQMEQIKKEMEQGKLKASTLPPISYFADDIPMLPGEAGTRLLQTVKVGEKLPQPSDLRHRIESVPGKLAVHTQNEDGGLSQFGILQMKWTTGVPTVKDKLHPPQKIPQYRSQYTKSQEAYIVSMNSLHRLKNEASEEELNLPPLSVRSPSGSNRQSPSHYEWELPLPPPPAKESRTNIPTIKKDHDSYCKYYELVKKKLHLYTSQKRERTLNLPEVLVKRIREAPTGKSGSPRKPLSPSKTAIGSQLLLPPIKLGQLVKIY